MNYAALCRMSPDSKILWMCWLIGNTECLIYMSGSQNTMASVYGEVDDCKILKLVCSHGLIEVQCYTGIEKKSLGVNKCSIWYLCSKWKESLSSG